MKQRSSAHQIDMVHGPLAGKLLLFALPLMLSSLLQLLFNAADVVVVGRFAGPEALAAVGSTTSLINLMVNIFIGLSVGANVVVARDLGAGREEEVRKGVHTSITLALIGGGLLLVLGAALARQLLEWTSSPADVIDLATLYLRIYFFGMPANMVYNFGAAILRAQGDTQRPLYFLTAAGILNAVLNLFFVIVCHLSVAGVALATIISQYLSAVLVAVCLLRDKGLLRLDLKQLGLDRRTVKRIAQVGLPAGFQGMVFSISNVVIQSSINSFDNTAIVAGSAASSNSQNYGAGETKRVDRTLLLCQAYVVATGLILGTLAVTFGHSLASIYAPGEEEVIAQAQERLRIAAGPYFLCGMMDTMVGVLRGIGYSVIPMVVSMVGACGLRLVWVATVFQWVHTPAMLYLSYPVSWAVTALVHLLFFLFVRKHAYAKVRGIHGTGGGTAAPVQEDAAKSQEDAAKSQTAAPVEVPKNTAKALSA